MTDAAGTRSVLLVESEEASRNRAGRDRLRPPRGHRLRRRGRVDADRVRLLSAFARNPHQVLDARRLLELAWGDPLAGSTDQVKLYVSYLRRKLRGAAGVEPISTVRGFGYRYDPN